MKRVGESANQRKSKRAKEQESKVLRSELLTVSQQERLGAHCLKAILWCAEHPEGERAQEEQRGRAGGTAAKDAAKI